MFVFLQAFLLAVALSSLSVQASAQILTRLLDLNGQPTGMVNLGSDWMPLGVVPTVPPTLYFSAWTEATGFELWKTQGTTATTRLVLDFEPGPGSSDPGPIGVLPNGDIVLPMTDSTSGRELRRVTEAGDVTTVVDAIPGRDGSVFSRLIEWGSGLYYLTQQPAGGGQIRVALHSTDGQSVTTVTDWTVERSNDDLVNRAQFASWRAGLLDIFDDGTHGRELLHSDGTAAGTAVIDLFPGPGSSDPSWLTEFNRKAYMAASVPGVGRELFDFDGSGVGLAADLALGAAGSDPEQLFASGNHLFFSADDGQTGRELFCMYLDGSIESFDLNPGPASSDPRDFIAFANRLWFIADDGVHGRELMALDLESPQTPTLPFDLNLTGDGTTGTFMGVYDPEARTPRLVFAGTDGLTGDQLWSTDGTLAGTQRLTDFRLGNGGARPRNPALLGNQVIFACDDDELDDELHKTDGTPAGTARLADVNPDTPTTGGSAAQGFTYFRGRTYFMASDGLTGGELWETDGSAEGTRRLTDVLPGQTSLQIRDIRPLGDVLFLVANNPLTVGSEPHVFDPRTGLLTVLLDIHPGTTGSVPLYVSEPVRVPTPSSAPLVFFSAADATNIENPWRTDGTPAGTFMVGNIDPGHPSRFTGPVRSGGGQCVLFTASNDKGSELWRTSGGRADAQMVMDIYPGSISSEPRYLTVFHGIAYFSAHSPGDGAELWRSDGTTNGTYQVIDIDDNLASGPQHLTVFDDRLFFSARHTDTGFELWTSDGTREGTALFRDLLPGTPSCSPRDLTVAADRLFFTGNNSSGDRVLWVTDGSTSNVSVVPGPINPKNMTAVGGKLYFSAGGPDPADEEFWLSDGTPEGTKRTDVRRGPKTSSITELRAAGGVVYVRADDGVTGNEPYVVRDTAASATPVGTSCGGTGTTLAGTPPAIGATMDLTLDFMPGGRIAFVIVALPSQVPVSVGPCQAPVDPGLVAVAGTFDTGAGGAGNVPLPIPNLPQFLGFKLMAWSLFADLATFDIATSNPLLLRLGR